jgi:site-specific DNA-methyltransferase (adenine-specific)
MKVQSMKLSELTPYEGNPRHNEQAIDKVAESIKQFGPRQPIVVDSERVIIVGHTRYFAALKLGLETFPVHVAKDLTPGQAALYRIADNRTAECATWDLDKLRTELEAIAGTSDQSDIIALGICVADWPELAVPDFEGLETDGDKSAGVRSNLLAIGKYRIALTDAEEAALVATVMKYAEESGTLFGFARWLLTKAGITVKEEVSDGEGQVTTLV